MRYSPDKFLLGLRPGVMRVFVFGLLFGAQCVCLGLFYLKAVQNERSHMGKEVMELARIAGQFLDVEAHERLTQPDQLSSALYRELVEPLVNIHLVSPGIHYLYTMREDGEGNEFFVLDTATQPVIEEMLLGLGREVEASGLLEEYEVPDEARIEEKDRAMRAGEPFVYEEIYEDEFGRFISAQAPLLTEDGEYVGYVGVDFSLEDYGERMANLSRVGFLSVLMAVVLSGLLSQIAYKMRKESIAQFTLLSQKEEEVRKEKERAEKAVDEKTDLIAMAVHDLKNPLSAIIGFTEVVLADKERMADGHQECFENVLQTAENMSEVILGILKNEGLERSGVHLEESVGLGELAKSVVKFNTFNATRKSIRFETSLESGVKFQGDRLRLREAMDNLVSNAVKYSPKGSTVRVILYRDQMRKQIEFAVTDQGEGVSEADQARLFQKFAKLSAKPTGGESSTGLGLSIVKTIISQHGGEVDCQSELGKGACFSFRLPLE
ncbi:MAG: sensor histidine kinase [Puniceicoccales bacterium]